VPRHVTQHFLRHRLAARGLGASQRPAPGWGRYRTSLFIFMCDFKVLVSCLYYL